MEQIQPFIKIQVNDKVYLKDPESSDLGNRILKNGLKMIHELGLEIFTFKKLAKELETTESSIYRYFENKHKLLIYFINYYWGYLDYKIAFSINNLSSENEKLKLALEILCDPGSNASEKLVLSMKELNEVVIAESSKAYLTKEVDEENKYGFFAAFKGVSKRIVAIVKSIDPNISYPNTMVSTCVEGIMHQQFFAKHLPSLSDFQQSEMASKRAEVFYQIITNNLNVAHGGKE